MALKRVENETFSALSVSRYIGSYYFTYFSMKKKVFVVVFLAFLLLPPVHYVSAETASEAAQRLKEERQKLKDEMQKLKQDLREQMQQEKEKIKKEAQDLKQNLRQNIQQQVQQAGKKAGKIINGEVTAKSGTTLTVMSNGTSYTINTDSNTKFMRHFWGKSSFGETAVGNRVNVWGAFTNDTTVQARMIRNLSVQKRSGVFFGTVQSKGSDSLVISTAVRGNQTVSVSSAAKIVNRNGETLTFGQVSVNERVRIRGVWDKSNNTIAEVMELKDFSLQK